MPGIYGSKKAALFVSEAIEGKSSVDFVHLGDSNTAFSDGGEADAGYADGFGHGMELARANSMYATPLYLFGPSGGPSVGVGCSQPGLSNLNGDNFTNSGALSFTAGTYTNDPAMIITGLTAFTSNLRPHGETARVVWRDSNATASNQRWASFGAGIYFDANCPIQITRELYYRVVGASSSLSTADMRITVRDNGAPNTIYLFSQAISFQRSGSDGPIVHRSQTIAENPARTVSLAVSTAGGGVGETAGLGNPVALGWHSVSTAKKGWASSCLSQFGGSTLRPVMDDVVNASNEFLNTYFREIILRQKACSGLQYARCIVTINCGQNLGDSSPLNSWDTNSGPALWRIRDSWVAAGGNPEDLAFILMTSHQVNATDSDRNKLRDNAILFASNQTNLNVTAVNLPEIVSWAQMTASSNAAFNNSSQGDAHLSEFGYRLVGRSVILELRNTHIMANTIASINPLSTTAAFAPDFRGESHNAYVTPTLAASGTVVLPKIESFPASFVVAQLADTAGNSRNGIITAHSAAVVTAFGTNVSTSAAAQTIVPSISSGVVTLLANSTFANAAAGAQPVWVNRIY